MDNRLIALIAEANDAEHYVLLVYDRHGRKVAQAALPSSRFGEGAGQVIVLTKRRFLLVRDNGTVEDRSLHPVSEHTAGASQGRLTSRSHRPDSARSHSHP